MYLTDVDAGPGGEENEADESFHDARDTLTQEAATVRESPRKDSERKLM